MSLDGRNEQNEARDARPFAFCQNCGRPLDQSTVRAVGRAVYCEPCLEARLAGATAAPGAGPRPAAGPTPGPGFGTPWQWGSGVPGGWSSQSGPNPGLAALLGFIPGVGAMYNEQYAKGIFHLLVFAVLVSLSHASDLFGFFAFGWICYMVIEAHHTARARRDGTPLPNPFGLNDLGERLGFGRAWPGGMSASQAPPMTTPAGTIPPYPPPAQPSQPMPPAGQDFGSIPPTPVWGAPSETYAGPYAAAYGAPSGAGYPGAYGPGFVPPIPPIPPVPPVPPYGAPFNPGVPAAGAEVPYVAPANRFPAGAVWLIGLGTIFLLSTTGIFHMVFGWSLVGFVLIGLAIWIFLRKMTDTGPGLEDDGSPGYSLRLVRALGPSVWLFAVGFLLLLDAFHVVPWHHSWPLFIILAGVMGLLQRAASNRAAFAEFSGMNSPAAGAPVSSPAGETVSAGAVDLHGDHDSSAAKPTDTSKGS